MAAPLNKLHTLNIIHISNGQPTWRIRLENKMLYTCYYRIEAGTVTFLLWRNCSSITCTGDRQVISNNNSMHDHKTILLPNRNVNMIVVCLMEFKFCYFREYAGVRTNFTGDRFEYCAAVSWNSVKHCTTHTTHSQPKLEKGRYTNVKLKKMKTTKIRFRENTSRWNFVNEKNHEKTRFSKTTELSNWKSYRFDTGCC